MLLAVLSDIHGNLEALREVLEDVDSFHPDRVVSLGDNVGYGPNPREVLETLWKRQIPSIMGNHELGLSDPHYLEWFNSSARKSLEITRTLLPPQCLEYVDGLERPFASTATTSFMVPPRTASRPTSFKSPIANSRNGSGNRKTPCASWAIPMNWG